MLVPQLKRDFLAWLKPGAIQAVPEDREEQVQLNPEEVDEDGVQILKAITMQGEDLDLEEALQRIRMRGHGRLAAQVKEELPEEKSLEVNKLFFSQKECSPIFKGGPYAGRPLEDCIKDLKARRIDPERDEWMTLDVMKDVENTGKLISVDNRRLFCLKEYQTYLHQNEPGKIVYVKVRLWQWTKTHKRYLDHLDTTNGGETIHVRRPRLH